MTNLLIGLTGSVASIKLIDLIKQLSLKDSIYEFVFEIRIILTKNAKYFIDQYNDIEKEELNDLIKKYKIQIYVDEDEWKWAKKGDEVLHIELRKWADILLIAPLSANSMAKVTNGICDNLLTCVFRAWDFNEIKNKPIFVAPAMNTCMYNNIFTKKQIDILEKELKVIVIKSIQKKLVCGDTGAGAMAEVKTIGNVLKLHLQMSVDMNPDYQKIMDKAIGGQYPQI